MHTHYDTLGIGRDAGPDEIRAAWRRLAKQHHPDHNPDDADAERKFKEVKEAYEVLIDERKKAAYDLNLTFGRQHDPFGAGPFSSGPFNVGVVDDFLSEVLRQGMDPSIFQRRRRGARSVRGGPVPSAPPPRTSHVDEPEADGKDVETDLTVTLEEAAAGCVKKVKSRIKTRLPCFRCNGSGCHPGTRASPCSACGGRGHRPDFDLSRPIRSRTCPACDGKGHIPLRPCKDCEGTGRRKGERDVQVRIPAGIDDGQKLRLAGQGEPGVGRPPGDLFVTVRVAQHGTFLRKGQDLYVEQPVPLDVALKGGEVTVPTLGGPPLTVTVPAGMEPGKTVVPMRGAGISSLMRDDRGDLYVTLQVELPKARTPRADRLIEELVRELRKGAR
jgi:molecular chaperone DnaJ